MDLCMYLYCLLALHTSLSLAFNPRHKLDSTTDFNLENTDSKISELDWKKLYLELRRAKTIEEGKDEKTATLNARKSAHPKPDSTWWPSKVDYSEDSNEIPDSSSDRERATQRSATFEELENRNANIYNPLLNLDHYPDPSKKYSFVELENMNANQYNPYLN